MAGTKRQSEPTIFEVVVSFDGLNKGEQFTQPADDMGWALQHVENGYLQVVQPEEVADVRGEVGKG
jgi:hypothetical protein